MLCTGVPLLQFFLYYVCDGGEDPWLHGMRDGDGDACVCSCVFLWLLLHSPANKRHEPTRHTRHEECLPVVGCVLQFSGQLV